MSYLVYIIATWLADTICPMVGHLGPPTQSTECRLVGDVAIILTSRFKCRKNILETKSLQFIYLTYKTRDKSSDFLEEQLEMLSDIVMKS